MILQEGRRPYAIGTRRIWNKSSGRQEVVKTRHGWEEYNADKAFDAGAPIAATLSAAEDGAKKIPKSAKAAMYAAAAAGVLSAGGAAASDAWDVEMQRARQDAVQFAKGQATRERITDKAVRAFLTQDEEFLARLPKRQAGFSDIMPATPEREYFTGKMTSFVPDTSAGTVRDTPEYAALYQTTSMKDAIEAPDMSEALSKALTAAVSKGIAASIAVVLAGFVARKVIGGIIEKRRMKRAQALARQEESVSVSDGMAKAALIQAQNAAAKATRALQKRYKPEDVEAFVYDRAKRERLALFGDALAAKLTRDAVKNF